MMIVQTSFKAASRMRPMLSAVALAACIADAAAASSTNSARVLASDAGARLDSNLVKGGGTDDTAALQRILDRAKGGRGVHLVIDGPALISGLDVHSHTTIECTAGGGFYLKDNSPRAIIRNAHRSAKRVTDQHIAIRGCALNGNRHRQEIVGPKDSVWRVGQEADGTWRSGLQFLGVHHLTLENVIIQDALAFGAWIANAKFVHVKNVTIERLVAPYPENAAVPQVTSWFKQNVFGAVPGPVKGNGNDDGLHFTGPLQYVTIDGLKLRTWDDGLAFIADYGCGELKDPDLEKQCAPLDAALATPYADGGPITDVTVNNVIFMDSHHGIRFLSTSHPVDRIVLSNLAGQVRERFTVISPFFPGHTGNFGSIVFNQVSVDLAPFPPWAELFPEWGLKQKIEAFESELAKGKRPDSGDAGEEADLPLFSLNGQIEHLGLHGIVSRVHDQGRPLVRVGPDSRIQRLNLQMTVLDEKGWGIPIKLMGRVEQLGLSIDGGGEDPIVNKGGSVGHVHRP